MPRIKKVFSDSIVYLATNFISKGIGFFLIPILTNPSFVSVEGYGQIILFSSFSLILNPFVAFGGIDFIAINYFDKNVDTQRVIGRSNTGALVFFGVTMTIFILLSPLLMKAFDIPFIIIILLPVSALLNYFYEELLLLLRFKGNAGGYFRIFVIKIILDVGVTLFCLMVLDWGWYARIAGILSSLLVSFFFTIRLVSIRSFLIPFREARLWQFLGLTAPFVLLQFFIIGLTNVDKLIIPQIFRDKTELAVYGLAFQVGYLLPTVATSVVTVTQPIIYKLLSEFTPASNLKLKKIVGMSYVAVIFAGLMVYLFTPLFYRIFIKDPRYNDGIPLVGYLLLAWLLWCCGAFLIDIIKKLGTRRQIVSSYFIPFVLLVACLYVFGSHYGLRGITYSLIISYGSILIILGIYARRQLNLLLIQNSRLPDAAHSDR